MMRLKDKVAVVTGGGRGIGRAIAIRFASEGARLAVNDIDLSYAQNVAETLEEQGSEALAIKANVGDAGEVEEMFDDVVGRFGRVDILVNNAGVRRDIAFHKLTEAEWDAGIATQLKGAFNCTRAAQRYMAERNYGKIINLSSPFPPAIGDGGQSSYTTAAAGVQGFTRAVAQELGPYNINVNAIAPDYIDTEMTRNAARRAGLYLADLKKLALARIPLRRMGTPEDVASVALFLASDESGFISGQTIYVRGGP